MSKREDTYDDLLRTSNEALYTQSSKVSTICRGMVYAIVATIWAISYDGTRFSIPKGWLLVSSLMCCGFIILDIIHYFTDSHFHYRRVQDIFKNQKLSNKATSEYSNKYVKQSKRSYYFLVSKFILALLIMIVFIIGLLNHS